MSKRLLICVLVMALVVALAGCACAHEWKAADCEHPKTCALCGEENGTALGHIWQEATCLTPKTCTECKATEGDVGSHTWIEANCSAPKTCSVCQTTEGETGDHIWVEANCSAPKTCSVCQTTEGEKGSHIWQDATCSSPKTCSVCQTTEGESGEHKWEEATTEAPKTCSVCKATSGKKLKTDYRFTTASTKILQGTWVCDVVITGEMVDLPGFGGVDCLATLTFGNTGTVTMTPQIKDEADAMRRYRTYSIDKLYSQYAEDGMSKEEADQDMLKECGYDVPGYVDSVLEQIDVKEMVAKYGFSKVYYVEGGNAFIAPSWMDTFESHTFSVSGGQLVISGVSLTDGGETLVWRRG